MQAFAALVLVVSVQGGPGKWQAEGAGVDMLLALPAAAPATPSLRGVKPDVPRLFVRCRDQKLQLGIDGVQLSVDEVTLRFDREPPQTMVLEKKMVRLGNLLHDKWRTEPGLYFGKPNEALAAFLRHRRLLIRMTPSGSGSIETVFELDGLDALLTGFEQACHVERPVPRPAPGTIAEAAPALPPPSPASLDVQRFGQWEARRSVSPLDDRPIVLLSLESETKVNEATKQPLRPTLILRCRERTAETYLHFGSVGLPLSRYVGNLGFLRVRASVDGGAPTEWALSLSTDRRAAFLGAAPQTLKRLLASHQLRLDFGPEKRKDYDAWMPDGHAVFELSGLADASRAFFEACPIELGKVKVKDGLGPLQE